MSRALALVIRIGVVRTCGCVDVVVNPGGREERRVIYIDVLLNFRLTQG